MTLFDDLRLKLDGAKSDLEILMAEFHQVVELKNALEKNDTSLRTASENLTKLTKSLEASTSSLTECVVALRTAVTDFDTSDLDEIRRDKNALGQRITRVARAVEELETRMAVTSKREWILLLLVTAILGLSALSFYYEHNIDWTRFPELKFIF